MLAVTVILIVAVFIVLIGNSFGYFEKRIEGTKITFNVGTLSYELECINLTGCQVTIPANQSKVVEVNLTSLNKIGTKYELYYEVTLPKQLTNIVYGGHLVTTEEKLTYLIDANETKKIRLIINNVGGPEITLKLGVLPSLKNDAAILEKTQVSLNKEVFQRYYVYDYSGNYETFITPTEGTYKIELWGAQGGTIGTYTGGKGAYTSGIIQLEKGFPLHIYVGAQDSSTINGGYNGGGSITSDQKTNGASGGGATDVRLTAGNSNDFDSLKSRIMVAAGGGGGNRRGENYGEGYGGAGGTLIGIDGTSINGTNGYGYGYGLGGTQTSGGLVKWIAGSTTTCNPAGCASGLFGIGGGTENTGRIAQSGGGAGYYGGGSGNHGGAGGGSSFISGYEGCDAIAEESISTAIIHTGQSKHYSGKFFNNSTMVSGTDEIPTHDLTSTMTGNSGNGYARITFLGKDTYTIKYDANGGEGTMGEDKVMEYETFQLSKNKFTKEGYGFIGWALDPDKEEVIYKDQATVISLANLGDEVTLYAVWADEFVVTLDANGGFMGNYNKVSSGHTSSVTLSQGASVPVKQGQVLSLKPNQKYLLQFNYRSDGNNTFNVDFYPDDLPEVVTNATTTLQTYNWIVSSPNSNMGSSRIRFFNNQIVPNPYNIYISGINLYECTNCTLTSSYSVVYGSAYGNLPTPTRAGYTFNGWYTSPTGGTRITSTSSFLQSENQTLYARWTVNSYVITLDANGGFMGTYNKVSSGHASSVTLPQGASVPVKEGQVLSLKQNQRYLLQFNYRSDGNNTFNVDFYPDDLPEVVTNATTTLQTYNWIVSSPNSNMGSSRIRFFNNKIVPNPYNIYISGVNLYECTNCTLTSSYSATYGSAYGSLPTPTRTGYTFNGWYTSPTGGTKITSTSPFLQTENQTLYAQWQQQYTTITQTGTIRLDCFAHKTSTVSATFVTPFISTPNITYTLTYVQNSSHVKSVNLVSATPTGCTFTMTGDGDSSQGITVLVNWTATGEVNAQ